MPNWISKYFQLVSPCDPPLLLQVANERLRRISDFDYSVFPRKDNATTNLSIFGGTDDKNSMELNDDTVSEQGCLISHANW